MKPGEFKTLREGIGFCPVWIARRAKVDAETALMWDSGALAPPDELVAHLQRVEAMIQQSVAEQVEWAVEAKKEAPGNSSARSAQVLFAYRTDDDYWMDVPGASQFIPASHVEAKVFRVQNELETRGIISTIVYLDILRFEEWLKENHKEDSYISRCEWGIQENFGGDLEVQDLRGAGERSILVRFFGNLLSLLTPPADRVQRGCG